MIERVVWRKAVLGLRCHYCEWMEVKGGVEEQFGWKWVLKGFVEVKGWRWV